MIIEATIAIRLTETEYREVSAVIPPYHDEWRIEMPAQAETVATKLATLHAAFAAAGMTLTFAPTPASDPPTPTQES